MSIDKKTLNELNTYTAQKVYENTDNLVTATMMQDLVKTVSKTTVPSNQLNPGTIPWEPTHHLLFPSALTGEGNTLEQIETLDVNTGAIISVKILNKIYQYELQYGIDETESPNYIRPVDYDLATNAKVWTLLNERIKTFTAADLVDGVYTYNHKLNSECFTIQLKDPNGIFIPVSQQIKATNNYTIEIDFGGEIEAGTFTLYLK